MGTEVVFKTPQKAASQKTPFSEIKVKFPKKDILAFKFALDTAEQIYQVPSGKVFILEGYWISAHCSTGGISADCNLYSSDGTANNLLATTLEAGQDCNLSLSLPRGLRFPACTSFEVLSGSADASTWAGIVGYEIDQQNLFYLD